MFKELDEVLITRLLEPTRQVDGTGPMVRQPLVGDRGTVVYVLDASHYVVECV